MFTIKKSFASCADCDLFGSPSAIVDTNTPDDIASAEVIFGGEGPAIVETHLEKPFTGLTGYPLRIYAEKILKHYKWIITNVTLCITILEGRINNPSVDVVDRCALNIINLISLVKPRLVVVCGKTAAFALLRELRYVYRVQESFHPKLQGIQFYTTYHPRYPKQMGGVYVQRYIESFDEIYNLIQLFEKKPTIPLSLTEFLKNFKMEPCLPNWGNNLKQK